MSLSFLGEEDLNPHEVAWKSKDWDTVKELSKEFKKSDEQSLFDILNNVTQKSGYHSSDHFESYNQYAINNALSQHIHLRGYTYELNQMEGLISDQMHYDYLYWTIRQTTLGRVKFAKISDDWEIRVFEKLVSNFYCVSIQRAIEYISEFNLEQIEFLKKLLKPTVNNSGVEVLSFIPTKTEREKIYRAIRDW